MVFERTAERLPSYKNPERSAATSQCARLDTPLADFRDWDFLAPWVSILEGADSTSRHAMPRSTFLLRSVITAGHTRAWLGSGRPCAGARKAAQSRTENGGCTHCTGRRELRAKRASRGDGQTWGAPHTGRYLAQGSSLGTWSGLLSQQRQSGLSVMATVGRFWDEGAWPIPKLLIFYLMFLCNL